MKFVILVDMKKIRFILLPFFVYFLLVFPVAAGNGYAGNENIKTGLSIEEISQIVKNNAGLTDFSSGITEQNTRFVRFADKTNKCGVHAFFNREGLCFQIQIIYYSIPETFSAANNELFYDKLHHYYKKKYGNPQYADDPEYFALVWFRDNNRYATGLYFFKNIPATPVSIIDTDTKLGEGIPVPARMNR